MGCKTSLGHFVFIGLDEAVVAGGRLEGHPGPLGRHARQNDRHPQGTLEAEHVGVVHHPHQLLPLRRTVLRAEDGEKV